MNAAALLILALGAWTANFNEETSELALVNESANVRIEGRLNFLPEASNAGNWRFAAPRDGVKDRLALLDGDGNAQGYLTFIEENGRLELLFYHRTRQYYKGRFQYIARADVPENGFVCRTKPDDNSKVLTFVSGFAASRNFDSVFMPESDALLQLEGMRGSLWTFPPRERMVDGKREVVDKDIKSFYFGLIGDVTRTGECVFAVELKKDYLKKRWVPYYSTIDRKRTPKAPTGWMSWNVYFDKATAEDNLAEARIGKKYLQPFGLEFWSIESWQGNSDALPVSNFWNLNLETNEKQFPLGMKKLADDIRELGFRPGLWTAPFGTGSDEFYNEHKDWFLHDADGNPMRTWNGKYTIDPSNDEVIDHLRKIHDVAARDWGYEFFKIDGMSGSGPGYSAHFFERPEVKAAFKNPDVESPFERCVRALREGIGNDRVFLACQGHFTGPEAAYADAARTGADIVHPNEPVKWENVLNQMDRTLNQVFVNNIVFYTDPDTLLTRDLPIEEARVSATVVALPGQLTFFGDFLKDLPEEKMKLLQQTLPVADVRPAELYPIFERRPIWDLKIGRSFEQWDVLAFFNWSNGTNVIKTNIFELGLNTGKYVAYEFWTDEMLGETWNDLEIKLPPRSVRLVALHPVKNFPQGPAPQFLTSDRHIALGAVDLLDCRWDGKNTLSATFDLVAGFPTVAKFWVPTGWNLIESNSDKEGVKLDVVKEKNEILSVKMSSEEQGAATIILKFEQDAPIEDMK